MTLNRETKYGLTFGQMLSVLTIIGGILTVWVSLNIRVAQTEIRIDQLEKGRQQNADSIQQLYKDNREDHKAISDKLDRLIESVNDRVKKWK